MLFELDSKPKAGLSFRNLLLLVLWVMIWQGSFLAHSPIQISTWIPTPNGINMIEELSVVFLIVLAMERTLTEDYSLRRSYFNSPLLFLAAAVFISWVRGCIVNQRFAIVLEVHDLPEWPIAFLLINNAFRDAEEGPKLFAVIFLTMLPKAFESLWTLLFPSGAETSWGIVQSWRDGYFLDVAIIGAMVMVHYSGVKLKRLKWFLYAAFPVAEAILILGFRRAAILASVASSVAMLVTLPRSMRRRQWGLIGMVVGGFIVVALITNPIAVAERFMGVIQPAGEGSAYIRLLELPNVLQNIWRHPIFGVPFGVPWTTYYRMPFSAVYTTLGTHTSYLYWPLRMGIFGAIAFLWLYGSMCKAAILNFRFRRNAEDFFFGQISIQMMVAYFASSFFGLMYADGLVYVLSIMMVAFQLQSKTVLGTANLAEIAFWRSMRAGKIVSQLPLGLRLQNLIRESRVSRRLGIVSHARVEVS